VHLDVKPDNSERRVAIFKDNKLRLLMKLAGFDRLGDPDDSEASWIIPSSISAEKLEETLKLISGFEFAPPTYDDEKSAQDFLRSKAAAERTASKRRTAFDDDLEGSDGIDYDEEFEFPAGGPTARKSDILEKLKKTRRKRDKRAGSNELDDDDTALVRKRKRDAKSLADLEKRRKIKSNVFIHESDEEEDEEKDKAFFAREEETRRNAGRTIMKALEKAEKTGLKDPIAGKKRKLKEGEMAKQSTKKRKASDPISEDEEDETGGKSTIDDIIDISSEASSSDSDSDVDTNNDGEVTDTPMSSQLHIPSPAVSTSQSAGNVSMRDAESDSDDEMPAVRQPLHKRRAGFVVDESDSDE
jgi:replication fork protection complex subunit Tof1/Swi1